VVTTTFLLIGVAALFAGIFLCLVAMSVFTNESHGVSKSLSVIEAFSTAPQALKKELEPGFEDRVLSLKVVGMVVGLGAGVLFSILLGKGLGFIVGAGVLGTVAGYYAPNFYLHQKGFDRTEKMQRALPDALDLLTISVEAGLGFDAALSQVARNTEGPLAAEFARVLQEMQIGLGRSSALRALGERSTMPDLRSFTSAMVQADAFGIPIGQVLRVQSGEIRVKKRQRAEEAAQKIPVKIMVPLVLFILPALFVAVLGPAIISMMGMF
jgi:tight adherence protein C